MQEWPILFNGEMVRAILDGRKTQTRRVINKVVACKPLRGGSITEFQTSPCKGYDWRFRDKRRLWQDIRDEMLLCPYGDAGDRLWVRETWCPMEGVNRDSGWIWYKANDVSIDHPRAKEMWDEDRALKNRPSIHMPRWASRITLEVVGVHAEQVQDVNEDDVKAEGVFIGDERASAVTLNGRFRRLWDSINKKRGFGWDVNPWTWVVNFKVVSDG